MHTYEELVLILHAPEKVAPALNRCDEYLSNTSHVRIFYHKISKLAIRSKCGSRGGGGQGGGGQGVRTPWKITSYMGFYRE